MLLWSLAKIQFMSRELTIIVQNAGVYEGTNDPNFDMLLIEYSNKYETKLCCAFPNRKLFKNNK